jgi:hypothetical protein
MVAPGGSTVLFKYVRYILPQPNQQPKTTFVGVVLLSVRKTTTPPPPHQGVITVKAVLGNPGSWFSVCNLILTQLDILKTTSIFFKIEDDLNFLRIEDNLIFGINGWQPKKIKLKSNSIVFSLEDDPIVFFKWKTS